MNTFPHQQSIAEKVIPLRQQINLSKMTAKERNRYVKALIAWTPKMNDIYQTIQECRDNQVSADERLNMSLLGDSRTGKSTIARMYARNNPSYNLNNVLVNSRHYPSDINNPSDTFDFRKVLYEIDSNLPLIEESGLSRDGTWERILLACGGRFAHCMLMIKLCALEAIKCSSEIINYSILERIYEKHFRLLGYCNGNPFNHDFPLDDAIDRYSQTKFTNDNNLATNNRMNSKASSKSPKLLILTLIQPKFSN